MDKASKSFKKSSSASNADKSSKRTHRKKKRHRKKADKVKASKESDSPEIVSDPNPFSPGFESDISAAREVPCVKPKSLAKKPVPKNNVKSTPYGYNSSTERPVQGSLRQSNSTSNVLGNAQSKTCNGLQITVDKTSESLRWELTLSDSDEEEERLKIYKLNRRKRYLAASNQKQTHCVGSTSNASMKSENSNAEHLLTASLSGTQTSSSSSKSKESLYPGLVMQHLHNQHGELLCHI